MIWSPLFLLAWVVSIGFTVLVAAGILTYVRRTWQQIRADQDGSPHERLLDGLDQIQTQLYMLGERLERLERRLEHGDEEDPRARETPRLQAGDGSTHEASSPGDAPGGSGP